VWNLPGRWILRHRLFAAALALLVVAVGVNVALRNGGHAPSHIKVAQEGPAASAETPTGPSGAAAARAPASEFSENVGTVVGEQPILPGLNSGPGEAACTKTKVHEIGVTDSTITVGQVITDNPQLPQQFKPLNEGLQAFVNVYNRTGGLCGRKLKVDYRNDNLSPATHYDDTATLADSDFAFVGSGSLLDFLDYEQRPPFDPLVRGGGTFVPDVGGFPLSYGRNQSSWEASVIGSLSPVLVDGDAFKFLTADTKSRGTPCRLGGIVYLREPTMASQDQATIGAVAVEQPWGGGLGSGNTKKYAANLEDPIPAYEALVDRMKADGVNCVFSWTDVQSSINLVHAMANRGVWPQNKCTLGPQCFRVVWSTLAVYDQLFLRSLGRSALGVTTTIPHVPLEETSHAAVKVYEDALKTVRGAHTSSFSIFGFASGLMFVEALQACPASPTRTCLIHALRSMRNFTGGGLLGGTTPFRTTRATYSDYGPFNWKWLFNRGIVERIVRRNGKPVYARAYPTGGFYDDVMHVARGTPG